MKSTIPVIRDQSRIFFFLIPSIKSINSVPAPQHSAHMVPAKRTRKIAFYHCTRRKITNEMFNVICCTIHTRELFVWFGFTLLHWYYFTTVVCSNKINISMNLTACTSRLLPYRVELSSNQIGQFILSYVRTRYKLLFSYPSCSWRNSIIHTNWIHSVHRICVHVHAAGGLMIWQMMLQFIFVWKRISGLHSMRHPRLLGKYVFVCSSEWFRNLGRRCTWTWRLDTVPWRGRAVRRTQWTQWGSSQFLRQEKAMVMIGSEQIKLYFCTGMSISTNVSMIFTNDFVYVLVILITIVIMPWCW